VLEGLDAGNDTVGTTVSYSLVDRGRIEHMGAYGTASIDLTGNELANTLTGNGGANRLMGQDGNDVLYGMAGNDILEGGAGNDLLVGGQGSDVFAFRTTLNPVSNVDRIADFSVAEDRIQLSRGLFGSLSQGPLSATVFITGQGAASLDHRIVYNKLTGELFYDADGLGLAAQIKFATVSAGLALTFSHFTVL
jgi:Ca2+-binding RTX toxin-like protein